MMMTMVNCDQDMLQRLLNYEAKIDSLHRRSAAIVPVHLRKLPAASHQRVLSLVSHRPSDEVTRYMKVTMSRNNTTGIVFSLSRVGQLFHKA